MSSWFGCLVGVCLSGCERVSPHHRIPLYLKIVALSLRPAGSLLKIFLSKNAIVYAQFTNVSRHLEASGQVKKIKLGQN